MPSLMTSPLRSSDVDISDIVVSDRYQETKYRVFTLLLERLEAKRVNAAAIGQAALKADINRTLNEVDAGLSIPLNIIERSHLVDDVVSEILGLGPLDALLEDGEIDDIIVNGPHAIFIEKRGCLSPAKTRFRDNAHLMNIIQRIVGPVGRRVDEACPFVDARLPDGSRINVVIPPLALDGPLISIRKIRKTALSATDLLAHGSLSQAMLDYLSNAVSAHQNILVCGGTGSGKTTFLNLLSGFIDRTERLVTIEDAAELHLDRPHVARLETRLPNAEGSREVSARDLVRNALRMRPDRIILGEVRGVEAVDMLQAMSTGHDGSMSTMHANGTRDALGRLEMLVGMGGLTSDVRSIRRYIAGSIDVLVQLQRANQGVRRVVSIANLSGLRDDDYEITELFRFVPASVNDEPGQFEQLIDCGALTRAMRK